ncbi:MAG: hypothetical protein H0X41_02250 [Chitinophagaceae bacterium]|nr:hypothetical protein [Chitinophagaceae bacterium]
MYTGLVHLHSLLRWVIIILIVVALFRHLMGMTRNKPFTSGDKKIGLFLMISAHTQFLAGLILWFMGPWGFKLLQNIGFSAAMKDPVARFWIMEHNVGMLIAIALITISRGVSKKKLPDALKHKRSFWLYFAALIIILVSIPWPGRVAGRPLLP